MSVFNYAELLSHVGHDINCVSYGDDDNVAVVCDTCHCVLLDYDREDGEANDTQWYDVHFSINGFFKIEATDEQAAEEIAHQLLEIANPKLETVLHTGVGHDIHEILPE